MTIFRPGQRLIVPNVRVLQPSMAAAVNQWWLSGGVSAANCIAAYQAKSAASLAASYSNLANPGTYDAAPGVAPTFNAADGWTFNGSTQYLLTGVTPASGWSMIVRVSNVGGTDGTAIGARGAVSTDRFYMWPIQGSANTRWGYATGGINTSPVTTSGVIAIAGATAYRNGVSEGALSGTISTYYALMIAATNNAGTPAIFLNGKIQAAAIYNSTLNSTLVAAITTAMAAL